VNLRNKTRAELESVRPFVVDTTEDAYLLRCLDTYEIWALADDVSVTPSLLHHGYWESWITAWFTNNINEGDFVVDVGAHCGYFTMLFEHLTGPEGKVIAYEASPDYAVLLERTRQHNDARYIVENLALSDSPGTLTLTYPGKYTGSASVVGTPFDEKWGETHEISVRSTTLDLDFYGVDTPELIKIDAESAEELIWNGGEQLFHRPDAPVIVMEYSPTDTYSEEFPEKLFDYGHVTRIGFDGREEKITPTHLLRLTDWDMICIRRK
jgi:FkbM family methyltransferase